MRKSLWVKPEIRAKFEAKMIECLNIAKEKSGKPISTPTLIFRQSGGRAGVCSVRRGNGYITLNYDLVHKVNTHDEMLIVTLPHEVAHWVNHEIDGGWRGDPHGYNWKRIMAWFGVNDERCHNMDMTGVKRRQTDKTLFGYSCKCGFPHKLTSLKHRKHQAGRTRCCCRCKSTLVYTGSVIINGVTSPAAKKLIEVPRDSVVTPPRPVQPRPVGPQYRVVTKLINGVLTNVRMLVES